MTKHEELKTLYDEYVEKFDWDIMFINFFDPNVKTKLDEKIEIIKKCISQNKIFSQFDELYKLMDNYPSDIEEEGGNWDLEIT